MQDSVAISFEEFVGLLRGGEMQPALSIFSRFLGRPAPAFPLPPAEKVEVELTPRVEEIPRAALAVKEQGRKKWDDATILRMIKMKGEGKSTPDIAKEFGTTAGNVYSMMRRYEAHHKLAAQGAKNEGLAEHCARAIPRSRAQMIEYLRAAGYKIAVIGDDVSYEGDDLSDAALLELANKERTRAHLPIFALEKKAA